MGYGFGKALYRKLRSFWPKAQNPADAEVDFLVAVK